MDITKKLIDETKNGENVLSFEVVEIVLAECYVVDNQLVDSLHSFIVLLFLISLALIHEILNQAT